MVAVVLRCIARRWDKDRGEYGTVRAGICGEYVESIAGGMSWDPHEQECSIICILRPEAWMMSGQDVEVFARCTVS